MGKVKLALLGCGDVAQRDYLPECYRLADRAEIVAVCGATSARVQAVAAPYGIPEWYTDYRRMLEESEAAAVINLTPIQLHAETTRAALAAGKHVYTEKPVASSVAEAKELRTLARQQQRKLICAPCVMLFPQVRYAQQLLADNTLGAVYAARGHALLGVPPWQGYSSDPSPFFTRGGGPAFDMGVYPLHVLTGLLGPVRRVAAMVSKVLDGFVAIDGPAAGRHIPVEVDDNWQMLLDFGDSRLATVTANSVVVATRAPQVELYGLQGTVALDPIDVGAPLELLEAGSGWKQVTPPFPGAQPNQRRAGPDHHLGVEHLVDCIEQDREPLLSIDHALHVVEIIEKCGQASKTGQTQELTTTFPFSSSNSQ